MRFLKPIAGCTFWDKKRSSDIREQLGIFNINDKLTQYKIYWRNMYKEWMTTDQPKKISQTRWEGDFWEEGTGQGA